MAINVNIWLSFFTIFYHYRHIVYILVGAK